jgi:hypothetical protein
MAKSRFVVTFLCILFLFPVQLAAAQAQGQQESGAKREDNIARQDLKLTAIGDGTLSSGHQMAFRVYEAPDGTKSQVVYAQFASLSEAQQLIEEWLKLTTKVTSREHNKNSGGQLISDRIVALGKVPTSRKEESVIIRRDGLNCYLIESLSLQVAMQVEGMIEHK